MYWKKCLPGSEKTPYRVVVKSSYHAQYPDEYPEYYRVVDLRNGKQVDDGYRAIHLYFQRDNRAYPIKVQLWCAKDYQFNIWSHRWIYKYDNADMGKRLYDLYIKGTVKTEEDFMVRLKEERGEI